MGWMFPCGQNLLRPRNPLILGGGQRFFWIIEYCVLSSSGVFVKLLFRANTRKSFGQSFQQNSVQKITPPVPWAFQQLTQKQSGVSLPDGFATPPPAHGPVPPSTPGAWGVFKTEALASSKFWCIKGSCRGSPRLKTEPGSEEGRAPQLHPRQFEGS